MLHVGTVLQVLPNSINLGGFLLINDYHRQLRRSSPAPTSSATPAERN